MTPFVLIGRKKLLPEMGPSSEHVYDQQLQLWMDKTLDAPLVTIMGRPAQSSQLGETTITRTREGTDQPEVAIFEASQFGETTLTKTQEGRDQSEVAAFEASQFGETTLTETREGADRTENVTIQISDVADSHF